MASFKDNDKISYDDLAPSLQAMLKRSVSKDDLETFKNKVAEIEAKLNGIRLSVVNDVASIPNPQNNKEIACVLIIMAGKKLKLYTLRRVLYVDF